MNLIAWIRRQLGKGDAWVDRHKERAMEQPKVNYKRRDDLRIATKKCPSCGNEKVWCKNSSYKCTKCGVRFV